MVRPLSNFLWGVVQADQWEEHWERSTEIHGVDTEFHRGSTEAEKREEHRERSTEIHGVPQREYGG